MLLELGSGVWAELLCHTDPADLAGIWLSHLHPDHCGDFFAAYQWAANTKGAPRLPVFGPPGWADRLGSALPTSDGGDQIRELFDVHDHSVGLEKLGAVEVTAIPVWHSVPAFGLRLVHKGASLAFSGDSGPTNGLAALAADVDLLLCEAGSAEVGQPFHCAPEEAASVGTAAGQLVLTHLAPGLEPAEASRRAGGAEVAHPGLVLPIA